MKKTVFENLESRMGYHYNPNSVINDRELRYRCMSTLRYDWPHVYLQQGLFGKELEAFMQLARAISPNANKPAVVRYTDCLLYTSDAADE